MDLEGRRLPPLVYSTELARSVSLGYPEAVRVEATGDVAAPEGFQLRTDPHEARYVPLERVPVSRDLVYGLMNVRTDGHTILCATLEERRNEFDVKVLRPGP